MQHLRVNHWSHHSDLTVIRARYHGSGIKGAEGRRARAYPRLYPKSRIYLGIDGLYRPEPGLGPHRYQFEIPDDRIITLSDAYDLVPVSTRKNMHGSPEDLCRLEKACRKAGYGYTARNVVVWWWDLPVHTLSKEGVQPVSPAYLTI